MIPDREQIAKAIAHDMILSRGIESGPREVMRAIEDHYGGVYAIHDEEWMSERVYRLIEGAVVTVTWEAKS